MLSARLRGVGDRVLGKRRSSLVSSLVEGVLISDVLDVPLVRSKARNWFISKPFESALIADQPVSNAAQPPRPHAKPALLAAGCSDRVG